MGYKELFALVSETQQILEIGYTKEEVLKKQMQYPISNTKIAKCWVTFEETKIIITYIPRELINSVKTIRSILNTGLAESKGMCDSKQIPCPNPDVALKLIKELSQYGKVTDVSGMPDTYKVLYGNQ